MTPEESTLKKDSPDPEMLKKLLAACEIYDMDAVDAVMVEIEACEYSGESELVWWLRENVNHMNIREVKEKLMSLVNSE